MNTLKNKFRYISVTILTVLLFGNSYAQDRIKIDFFEQIKNYNLSKVIAADSIISENREEKIKEKVKRPEILGFIGNNYQRFFIHFTSVIQNPTNPYEYLVSGKTKVRETICTFQGTITIKQAKIYKSSDFPNYKQGYADCDVNLYEDKKQPSTGFIKGKLKSHFLIDNKGQFRYDALNFFSDGFSNNQFVGSWTSYKTNITKRCNWGDYRIPESGDLDIGVGEFSVNDKYLKNGWKTYKLAQGGFTETSETKQAKQKEEEQWWR
ncbi:hypothetical protein FO615_03730 [Riemerella anatipestifer]|nr:hypothetical protein [Riemerella anatipestifer]